MMEAPALLHPAFYLQKRSRILQTTALGFIGHSLARVNTECDSSFLILVSPVMVSAESSVCIERDWFSSRLHMLICGKVNVFGIKQQEKQGGTRSFVLERTCEGLMCPA